MWNPDIHVASHSYLNWMGQTGGTLVAFNANPGTAIATLECLQGGGGIGKLIGPFSNVIDGVITDKFIRNWLDLLSFLLSGMTFLDQAGNRDPLPGKRAWSLAYRWIGFQLQAYSRLYA